MNHAPVRSRPPLDDRRLHLLGQLEKKTLWLSHWRSTTPTTSAPSPSP